MAYSLHNRHADVSHCELKIAGDAFGLGSRDLLKGRSSGPAERQGSAAPPASRTLGFEILNDSSAFNVSVILCTTRKLIYKCVHLNRDGCGKECEWERECETPSVPLRLTPSCALPSAVQPSMLYSERITGLVGCEVPNSADTH